MFDKMIFNTKIDFQKDAAHIAKINHLQLCSEGTEPFYQSSSYGNFDGLFIRIRGDTIQIKCSLHKLFYKMNFGILDNSQPFMIDDAMMMIDVLFERIGISQDNVKVTYYEIGLNIPVEHDPTEYIGAVMSIGRDSEKELFNDANFRLNRQKTTEKSKTVKKVLKIYDKGFEASEKNRTVAGNVLRLETVYRRQSVPLSLFKDRDWVSKMAWRFYHDWQEIEFPRRLEADKGIKSSQIEKARNIMQLGRDAYYLQSREEYCSGCLSKKQWETIRTFISGWDLMKSRFRYIPTDRELEYREKLENEFKTVIITKKHHTVR